MMLRSLLIASLTLVIAQDLPAQVIAPPPPKTYDVTVRYRIRAGRNVRLVQYAKLMQFLEKIGFQKNPGPDDEAENPNYTRMTGRIDSANVKKLLDDEHIKTLLLFPPGYQVPEEDDRPIKVQLTLANNISFNEQHALHSQVLAQLRQIGFVNAIAYDHRGYTRIVGRIPAGQLETLLDDLRSRPAGWLVPETAIAALPMPIQQVPYPVRITEVIPEPKEAPAPAELKVAEDPKEPHLRKITPELRERMAADADKPTRIEAILVATPGDLNQNWQRELIQAVPQLIIEGRLGPIVSGRMPPGKASDLAQLDIVSTIRLPTSGAPLLRPAVDAKDMNPTALGASGVARLHALGHKGKGVRLGVIGGDFRGWEEFLGKGLPKGTKLVDLTMERNSDIEPEPYPEDGQKVGAGTRAALAAAVAAPEADLVLIRMDPSSPYQLLEIMRRINGEAYRSITRDQRDDDFVAERERLRRAWDAHFLERRILFQNFDGNEEGVKEREAHFRKTKDLEAEETRYQNRVDRLLKLERDLRDLSKLNVAVNTLVYHQGHQVDGSSPLSRYLDDRPFRNTIWIQPGGDIRGQTWAGLFTDRDQNGVMDFGNAKMPLPAGRWTDELSFLGWEPVNGKVELDLPAKATIRISFQWRETHDPEFLRRGEDLYREPLAKPRLMLLRQRDPTGKLLATDDMDLLTYTNGLPQRIDNFPESSTYEQSLTFTIDEPGRYALRIEGFNPDEIRPPTVVTLPAIRKSFELRPRILVEATDAASRAAGRPVFLDYATNQGSIGMPGDAHMSLTTGAADRTLRPQAYASFGPAMNLELMPKPNVLSFDGLDLGGEAQRGSSLAAAFAAGQTASILGTGVQFKQLPAFLPRQPATLLRVPDGWPGRR